MYRFNDVKEFEYLLKQSQKILEELQRCSVCSYCGTFYIGRQKNTKYCSSKCMKAMYEKNKLDKMTKEELEAYRLKERDRLRAYREKKKIGEK